MSTSNIHSTDPNALNLAKEILLGGGLVVIPTETVYGIAALATDGTAIKRIYQIKGREKGKALLPHVDGPKMAAKLAELSPMAKLLMAKFWPGPLTLVVPAAKGANIHKAARGGLGAIALRCPDHDFTLRLIGALDQPLVAPSANLAGEVPPTTISQLSATIASKVDLIVDGGAGINGQSSTIIDLCQKPIKILRQGVLDQKTIENVSGPLG